MSKLDMSLDDVIKMNKKSEGPNPRDRARNSGPIRRFQDRTANRSTPYSTGNVRAPETKWKHDMFADLEADDPVRAARVSAIETGTKLFVSNLDYGVSDEDIKELFSAAGHLKGYYVHYDRSGRSKGTAEVVFSRRRDAETAVERYNNVQLDGKPLKIEMAGKELASPATLPPSTTLLYENQNGVPSEQARGDIVERSRDGDRSINRARRDGDHSIDGACRDGNCGVNRAHRDGNCGVNRAHRDGNRGVNRAHSDGDGGGDRARVRGSGHGEKMSAEELDADLEKYHSKTMQTN